MCAYVHKWGFGFVLHIFTSDNLGYPAKLLQYSMMSVALLVIGVLNLD